MITDTLMPQAAETLQPGDALEHRGKLRTVATVEMSDGCVIVTTRCHAVTTLAPGSFVLARLGL